MTALTAATRALCTLGMLWVSAFFLASGTAWLASLDLVQPRPASAVGWTGPPPEAARPEAARSGAVICGNNVFDSARRPCAPSSPPSPPPDRTPVCATKARLIATFVTERDAGGFALLRGPSGSARPVPIGGAIDEAGRLSRVGWRAVEVVDERGRRCRLELGWTPPEVARGGPDAQQAAGRDAILDAIEVRPDGRRRVARWAIEDLLAGRRSVDGLGRLAPARRDGAMRGFRLLRVPRGGALERLGLRRGDVITAVGGVEMTSLDRPLDAYLRLRGADSIELRLERRGREILLRFDLIEPAPRRGSTTGRVET